ncbi:MAG TPA: AAA family ATPase [Clostridiales bacterium]|nr:AAA family ATPase [Clostridiales bacterium]
MKKFNITTTCIKEQHYMVDARKKLAKIEKMIDEGLYFTINRARQYGKTTTMSKLFHTLKEKYIMIRGSLEDFGSEPYKSEERFAKAFLNMLQKIIKFQDKKLAEYIISKNNAKSFEELSEKITDICMESEKEIVLMVDEVDKAGSNIIFLDFLAMLRDKYIKQKDGLDQTFKSIILAGVHDVKNLKVHIKERRMLTEEEAKLIDKTTYNSPWNVAEEFKLDMSFNPEEIATMLVEYEADYHTGMNIDEISNEIYDYTSGYPFLVSKICKVIDEDSKEWSVSGVQEAIRMILKENNTLFDDLIKNIENNKKLMEMVNDIIIDGILYSYVQTDEIISIGAMYGIFKESNEGKVKMHNKIFEILLYNHMSIKKERESMEIKKYEVRNQFIKSNGDLDMSKALDKFQELMYEEYREKTEKFIEKEGRLIFLAFIKPIINGTGFYFVETETRTNRRMDIVITYNKKLYIIELKKWYGKDYEERGYIQLMDYMDIKRADEAYMVIFDFRKEKKEYKKGWIEEEGKKIYEVIV